MIIDLTNTTRFYDADKEVKEQGIRYVKIQCKGHGETPTRDSTDLFLRIVESFITKNPLDLIGIHCTHGFNRTGFLICSYLVEKLDFSVDMAVSLFAQARPPGIYKQDYLNELFERYDPDAQAPVAPALPNWETEEEQPTCVAEKESTLSDDEDFDFDYEPPSNTSKKPKFSHPKKPRREESKLNPVFADPDLAGVEPCPDPDEISRVRMETQNICNWNGAGFPGSQPVSMDLKNITFLLQKKYRVSWKADGTRYVFFFLIDLFLDI